MSRIWLLTMIVVLSAPAPAMAQTEAVRYSMTPIEGGALRLDTLTGAVSRCVELDGDWSCRALPDDAVALQDEIDRLAEENAKLRAQIKPGEPTFSADEPVTSFKLPSDAEVDKAMSFVERVLKRFKAIVEDLHKEDEPGTAL